MLGVRAEPGVVTFDVDFVLTPQHPAYAPPPPGEREAFRVGRIVFSEVRRLLWEDQGAPPAIDASDEVDYGHIDSFRRDGETFMLEGDWGRMEIAAAQVQVEL